MASGLYRYYSAEIRRPYKVLALDCDNTLWGGIIGEDEVDGLKFEASHLAVQKKALELAKRGILICLVSKNNLADVQDAFNHNKDKMVLHWEDIIAHRINWSPKSSNIKALAEELNLGSDSFVFLDDSNLECEEVRSNAPEVLTLQFSENIRDAELFLDNVWELDQIAVTVEDSRRTDMYKIERSRNAARKTANTADDFIKSLNLDITYLSPANSLIDRISQMTQRTNQFNCNPAAKSKNDIADLLSSDKKVVPISVEDRFGSYGTSGLVIYDTNESKLIVDTFLLSCRILGRGVEHAVIREIARLALEQSCEEIEIIFSPTKKNEPARQFLNSIPGVTLPTDAKAHTLIIAAATAIEFIYTPKTVNQAMDTSKRSRSKSSVIAPSINSESTALRYTDVHEILVNATTIETRPRPNIDTPLVPPQSDTEIAIAAIWCRLIGLEAVGINDIFFDLGGTSLKVVEMVSRVRAELDFDISVADAFGTPTIAGLASKFDVGTISATADESKKRGSERRNRRPTRRRS